MEKYLPNAFYIRRLDDMTYAINNRDELEKIYGVRVPTDIINEQDYMQEVANTYPNREEKFFHLLGQAAERNLDEAFLYAIKMFHPDYIIEEGIAMIYSKYWREADYRILIEPSNWELLLQFVKRRREKHQPIVDDALANARCLAVQETLNNAQNISFKIVNNYDDKYEQAIQNICDEIARNI